MPVSSTRPVVSAVVSGEIYIKDLPGEAVDRIKRDLTLLNPLYASTEKFGSAYQLKSVPKTISYYRNPAPNVIAVPRGYEVKGVKLKSKINVVKPAADFPKMLLGPRPDQQLVLNTWKSIINKEYYDGTVVAPPAAGKSIIGLMLAHQMKLKTLVLVHKDTILNAWTRDITKLFGDKLKYQVWKGQASIKKGMKSIDDCSLVIASVQSLKNLDVDTWSELFGLVVVDECHRSASYTIYNLLENCAAAYRVGLTATPEREDGLDKVILFACGPVRVIIEKNNETTVPIEIIRLNTPFAVSRKGENPDSLQQHTIWKRQNANNQRRESLLSLLSFIHNHKKVSAPVLLLCNHIDACEELASLTGGFHFHSKLKKAEREKFMEEASEGKIRVTVATPSMMGEGVNVPPWTHLILYNTFTAKTLVRQTCGRVERKWGNKEKGFVWDFVDDCPRCKKQFGYRFQTYCLYHFKVRTFKIIKTQKNSSNWVLRERKI